MTGVLSRGDFVQSLFTPAKLLCCCKQCGVVAVLVIHTLPHLGLVLRLPHLLKPTCLCLPVADGQNPEYSVMRSPLLPPCGPELAVLETSTIWGPTCDSADVVYKDVPLPQIRNGDWLLWPNAGVCCHVSELGYTPLAQQVSSL